MCSCCKLCELVLEGSEDLLGVVGNKHVPPCSISLLQRVVHSARMWHLAWLCLVMRAPNLLPTLHLLRLLPPGAWPGLCWPPTPSEMLQHLLPHIVRQSCQYLRIELRLRHPQRPKLAVIHAAACHSSCRARLLLMSSSGSLH